VADGGHAADCESGRVAHPASIRGLRFDAERARNFLNIDAIDTRRHDQDNLFIGAQDDRFRNLRDGAADCCGRVLRRARSVRKNLNRVGMAGFLQRRAHALNRISNFRHQASIPPPVNRGYACQRRPHIRSA
jgi:hypothetical protein